MAAFPVSGWLRSAVVVVAVVLASALVMSPVALATDAVRTTSRTARGIASTAVIGTAWTADNQPIPGAHVQLRDVVSGKVRALAVADETGRFTFTNLEGGTYVVELVGTDGKVITVGHAFGIAPGDTVATFVRLGTKVPWFNGFFNNAASAVAATASSQGITAIAPVQNPTSSLSSVR